jgi:pimeloyl-ACP methyl ester carboxylesterase
MTPALRFGRGPHKAVLMNGWFGCTPHWRGFLEAVDPEAFELALFDYRGYGTRRDEAGECSFEAAAQDVLVLADTLGWPRFSLVGHSMGGVAMQRAALAARGRVDKLVGLAPVSAATSGFDAARLAMFEGALGSLQARQRIVDFSTGKRLAAAWTAHVARDSWEANAPRAMAAYLPQWALAEHGFADAARTLQRPVLVMVGEHDPSITRAAAEATWGAHHPQAVIETVANAGHYPMQEAPVAVATRVQQFLLAA